MSNIMEPSVFVSSVNTEMPYADMVAKLFKLDTAEMEALHAAIGVAGEAGELCDAIKKHVIYGKEFDRKNVVEELGDLRFYMQHIMSMAGITEAEVLQGNADKLSDRYKKLEYSNEAAIARADKDDSPA
jgi:NTP pyrophosphatase (non-canonical NTP hydrolase)